MNEEKIRNLLERQIIGTFMKAKLTRIPKIEIHLKKPNKEGWIKNSNGENCLANISPKNQDCTHIVHYHSNGDVWYEEDIKTLYKKHKKYFDSIKEEEIKNDFVIRNIWKEPIQFLFPLGKNEYCYTHLARHEAIHYIRELDIKLKDINKKEQHDKIIL